VEKKGKSGKERQEWKRKEREREREREREETALDRHLVVSIKE